MNPEKSPLELWLAEISANADALSNTWDPGFDGGRQIVIAQLGVFQKTYQRPTHFVPRFYHQTFPLPVEEWRFNSQIKLYGNFCIIDALLTIRFQASLKYAQANIDALPNINQHIKARCDGLVKDIVDQELRKLTNGDWVEQGLSVVELRVETQINETLTLQNIQCRTLCEMLATFSEISDTSKLDSRFGHDDIYLKILKKNFDTQEHQNQERLRQELELEQQRLKRQQRLIDQYNQEQGLHRIEQEQSALNLKRRLEEQERQLGEQFLIEERVHREQVYHEQNLKRVEQEVAAITQQEIQTKQLETEQQLLQERLAHQQRMKEIQLAAEIAEFEKNQEAWNLTHERLRIEKIEQETRLKQLENEAELTLLDTKQNEEQKLQERLLMEKMTHEARMKAMELEMQIQEHEKRFTATQQLDNYLRRDIELLVLERHRGELMQEVKKTKHDEFPAISAPTNPESSADP
ncbi:hypothetical protein [Methyloglobulus sp.]|uniref:hypothetical protein n=1 Tax=Methyloglobulus sp. TaxID=2518622 RepID=UPI0032B814C2